MKDGQYDRWQEEQAYSRYQSAIRASASLKARIYALAAMRPRDTGVPKGAEIDGLLRDCEADVQVGEAAHQELLEHIPPHYRKPSGAGKLAGEVFDTAELLEHILSYISVVELLSAYSVSKTFSATIEGSIKLRRLLGLEPDPDGFFDIPAKSLIERTKAIEAWSSVDLLHYGIDEPDEGGDQTIKVMICVNSMARIGMDPSESIKVTIPALGSRCARMLVSQPPTKEIRLYVHCCASPRTWLIGSGGGHTEPTMTIRSDVGVTVGQIYEAIRRVQSEHRFCIHDDWREYDFDGMLYSKISIEGSVSLRSDDPILLEKERLISNNAARRRPMANMLSSSDAKRLTRDQGNPIAMFVEFEAAQ